MGYRVIVDAGMTGQMRECPEAVAWNLKNDTLKVGRDAADLGTAQDIVATFNWENVAGIEEM